MSHSFPSPAERKHALVLPRLKTDSQALSVHSSIFNSAPLKGRDGPKETLARVMAGPSVFLHSKMHAITIPNNFSIYPTIYLLP
jgi:hypothetical protein